MATSNEVVLAGDMGKLISAGMAGIDDYKLDLQSKNMSEKHQWLAYLGVAPLCLELLAMCKLIAAHPDADGIEISLDGKYPSLEGCKFLTTALVRVGNIGRTAFMEASTQMGKIQTTSGTIGDIVDVIMTSLEARDMNVRHELESFKRAANTCKDAATIMDDELGKWDVCLKELHEVCDATDQKNKTKYQITLSNERTQKLEKEAVDKLIEEKKQEVEKADADVQEWKQATKDQIAKFPSGWELVGMDAVQTLTTAVGQSMVVATAVVASRYSGGGAFNNNNSNDSNKSSSNGTGSQSTASKDDTTKASDEDSVATDPASIFCSLLLRDIEQLKNIVSGEKGVRWDLITNNTPPDEEGQLDMEGVKGALKNRRRDIEKKKERKNSPVGKSLLNAINLTETVITELSDERKDSKSLNKDWKKPTEDSSKVAKWRDNITGSRSIVKGLDTQVKASAGATRPLIPDLGATQSSGNSNQPISRTVLEAHSFKVETARKIYQANLENADRARERCLELQKSIIKISTELDQLAQSRITLEKIKEVLRNCMVLLVQLKDNVALLKVFFSTLATEVQVAINSYAIPFTSRVESLITHPTEFLNLAVLNTYVAHIWASFDNFKEIAIFYSKVHNPYITRGLSLVDDMGFVTKDENLALRFAAIKKYRQESQEGVAKLIAAETESFKRRLARPLSELIEASRFAIRPASTDEQIDRKAIEGAQKQLNTQMEQATGPLKYLGLDKEERDKRSEQLDAATNPQTTLQRALAAKRRRVRDEEIDY